MTHVDVKAMMSDVTNDKWGGGVINIAGSRQNCTKLYVILVVFGLYCVGLAFDNAVLYSFV